ATVAANSSATWSGPAVASMPKVTTVSAMSAISATSGMAASSRLGERGASPRRSGESPSGGRVSPISEAQPQLGRGGPGWVVPGVIRLTTSECDEADDRSDDHEPEDRTRQAAHPGSDPVSQDRAGHAVPAPAPLAELEALDLDDLDAGLAHPRDRVRVALVGDDDARLDGHDVVAVVPLLAFLLVDVPARLDHLDAADVE